MSATPCSARCNFSLPRVSVGRMAGRRPVGWGRCMATWFFVIASVSEAIQKTKQSRTRLDCFVAFAPRNDDSHPLDTRFRSRSINCSGFSVETPPSNHKRAREMPGAGRARSPMCKGRKHTGVVTAVTPDIPAFPRRWRYGFLRSLPGDRLFVSVGDNARALHRTPASGCQDAPTSPSAKPAVRLPAVSWPSYPAPNVRDDRETPLWIGAGRTKACQ
jgi:hypothetical protein